MSLKHAVLALVVERRGYGYDLAQRLEERLGPAWRLNPSAVYPALDQLERAGLVTGTARGRGTRRTTRVVYAATRAGDQALDAWLRTTSSRPEPVRSELQLRLAFARAEHRDALVAQLAAQERACAALLACYDRRPSEDREGGAARLIDDAVLGQLRAQLRWLREARAALVAGALDDRAR
jgi:DNA-binding PadR family transcriptional regulator